MQKKKKKKKMHSMFYKKLPVDKENDDLPAPQMEQMGGTLKIQIGWNLVIQDS